jgi:hypothetical protein
MPDPSRRPDGFAVCSGLAALLWGPLLLARGAPAGWTFLLITGGLVLLSTQWVIATGTRFTISHRTQVVVGLAGVALVAVALVYLSRAANDLPSLFPGYDGDSEHFRIVPGIVTLSVGLVLCIRSLVSTHPTRTLPDHKQTACRRRQPSTLVK